MVECIIRLHLRAHLHQCGAGPPMGAGVFSAPVECLHWRGSTRSFTICGGPISRHWVIDLYILTNQRSLFLRVPQKNRSVSDLCGPRCGPATEASRAHDGVNSTAQFLQTDPLRSTRAGSPRAPLAFSRIGVNAP